MVKGFSLIEVILATALFGIYAAALLGILVYGNESAVRAAARARSIFLAEEGIEATRSLRNTGWDNLVDGRYGVTSTPAGWQFFPTEDKIGRFTRNLAVSSPDASTKKIISSISWPQGNDILTTTLTAIFTNWQFVSSTVCTAP